MGIRFECPNGHHLHVKSFLAGQRGICPDCDARFIVPSISGRRVEAISEPVPQAVAPDPLPTAPPAIDTSLPRIDVSATPRPFHHSRRDRRIQRARSVTMALSILVIILLASMVLVLIR